MTAYLTPGFNASMFILIPAALTRIKVDYTVVKGCIINEFRKYSRITLWEVL